MWLVVRQLATQAAQPPPQPCRRLRGGCSAAAATSSASPLVHAALAPARLLPAFLVGRLLSFTRCLYTCRHHSQVEGVCVQRSFQAV